MINKQEIFPILNWLPEYKATDLKKDLLAGLTVGTMLVPQGMAYALLAGLPPIVGLYAALVPLLVYPVFSTSRYLSVGPVAMDSLLVASGVGALVSSGSDQYLQYAITLALMVGVIQLIMGVLKLGFLINFLSRPLINGFTSAAAIIIGLSQLKHLLGIDIIGSQQVHLVLARIFSQLSATNLTTLSIGLVSILVIVSLKKWKPSIPSSFIAIVVSTALVYLLDLQVFGVKLVGEVPVGLPALQFASPDLSTLLKLLPSAIAIAFISFMESIAIGKKTAEQRGQVIKTNQELAALGFSNLASGLFGGYPIAGSFSRTAVSVHAGAQTGMTSVFKALIIALTLLFLTPLFYFMPLAVLGSVVIVAVAGLIDIKEPKRLFTLQKRDFVVLIIAFASTLTLGAQSGIIISAALSMILIIQRISRPNIAVLGEVKKYGIYRDLRNVPEAEEIPGILMIRMDAAIFYANSQFLKDKLQQIIGSKPNIKTLVFHFEGVNDIDATGISTLIEIADFLRSRSVELHLSSVKNPVLHILRQGGFVDKIRKDHFHLSLDIFLSSQKD